jgi:hypothetical protein
MTRDEATVGTRVKTLVEFCNVPAGSEGVIDEDYGTGVMVAWDLPHKLRDGFDKESELHFLEKVGEPQRHEDTEAKRNLEL